MKKYYRFITDIIDKIYPEDFIAPKTKYQVKEFLKMFPEDWQEVSASEYYIQEGYLPEEYIVDTNRIGIRITEILDNYYSTKTPPFFFETSRWRYANCFKTSKFYQKYDNSIEPYLKELPIFTYDQYKQLFYKDNFVLPNNWWVRVTEENVDVLKEWSGKDLKANKSLVGICKNLKNWYKNEYDIGWSDVTITKGETYDFGNEITYKQFLKYVLKKEDIEEKEIIGYEAPMDLFDGKVKKGDIFKLFQTQYRAKSNGEFVGGFLPKEIVETWAPVYKEEDFKVGDWVYVINGGNGAMGANTFIGKICTQKTALELIYGGEINYVTAPIYVENNSSSWGLCDGYQLRKATPEEIKAAQIPKIEINGYRAQFFSDYVKFGCQKYSSEFVIQLNDCLQVNGFKMDHKDSIKQIAEYYLNK